jgi:hypothetical protein
MKPNKTFKMDKSTKRMLASLTGAAHTNFKRDMIQAQLLSQVVVRDKKKSKVEKNEE